MLRLDLPQPPAPLPFDFPQVLELDLEDCGRAREAELTHKL